MLGHMRSHGRVPISQKADRLRGQCGQELLLWFFFGRKIWKQKKQGQQVWDRLASLISVGSGM